MRDEKLESDSISCVSSFLVGDVSNSRFGSIIPLLLDRPILGYGGYSMFFTPLVVSPWCLFVCMSVV